MPKPNRGEVWQTDMGIAGKVRPRLLLTEYPADHELALVTVIPHTTAVAPLILQKAIRMLKFEL